jgi:hypothetical protein
MASVRLASASRNVKSEGGGRWSSATTVDWPVSEVMVVLLFRWVVTNDPVDKSHLDGIQRQKRLDCYLNIGEYDTCTRNRDVRELDGLTHFGFTSLTESTRGLRAVAQELLDELFWLQMIITGMEFVPCLDSCADACAAARSLATS